jgi:hypothetical protein
VGKIEAWRSLGTDSLKTAGGRSIVAAAMVEKEFEAARSRARMPVDPMLLDNGRSVAVPAAEVRGDRTRPTLREVYDAYMGDPTQVWLPSTRLAYETTPRLSLEILG